MIIDEISHDELSIEELLTNNKMYQVCTHLYDKRESYFNMLSKLTKLSSNCTIVCNISAKRYNKFTNLEDIDDRIYPGHVYSIKKIVEKKYVLLNNPYNSKEDIKMDYYDFAYILGNVYISANDTSSKTTIKSLYTNDYKLNEQKDIDKASKEKQEKDKKRIQLDKLDKFIDFLNDKPVLYLDLKSKIENGSYEQTLSKINSLNDEQRFCILYKDLEEIIKLLDDKAWGWGNGAKKKALIEPFVNSLCNIAKDYICQSDIENIKNACLKELNATFYTDEEKIIEKLMLLKLAVIREINANYQRLKQEIK